MNGTLSVNRYIYFCPMWRLQQVTELIRYLTQARTPAQMHSPFLFDLLMFIHDESREYYVFDKIEKQRARLLAVETVIPTIDLGAGSRRAERKTNRTVRQIAKTSLSTSVKCRMTFRLLAHETPQTVLELGTSLGIMTAYLAAAGNYATVHTVEGNPDLSAQAAGVAAALNLENIRFHTGAFDKVLPSLLPALKSLDFVLIDGDHRGDALLRYYQVIEPYLSEDAILMIDDIRWSPGMFGAWAQLQRAPDIHCSLDYYWFGLLFRRKEFKQPVHYQIIPGRVPLRLLR